MIHGASALCSRGVLSTPQIVAFSFLKKNFDICLEGLIIINKNLRKACRLEKVRNEQMQNKILELSQ
jgi:hypothetical protein